ncbi:MAG: hypothetical protein PHE06_08465 [Lachnospiraceae bacterium]|nr:hypothetical protein [Lachnospiraceae bacterium]MDD3795984.1 hypothetical protein [Lachnospiraceae bacterium]
MITLFCTLLAGSISLMVWLIVGGFGLLFYIWQSVEFYWLLQRSNYRWPWLAWLPFFRYFALAGAMDDGDGFTSIYLIGQRIQTDLFRFWPFVALLLSRVSRVGSLLEVLFTILCLGSSFTSVYSRLEGRDVNDVKVLGYLSGWIPLIGVIKITGYRHRQRY